MSKKLSAIGHESIHVNQILDKWFTKDGDIIEYADKNDCILITKDQDFKNTYLIAGKPNKLIRVGLGNISNDRLIEILLSKMDQIALTNQQNDRFMIEIYGDDLWILSGDPSK